MAIIISEIPFTQKQIEQYTKQNIRLAQSDGKNLPFIYAGEAVKFILNPDRLYAVNIRKIEDLLYTKKSKHNVTIQLENDTWYLTDPLDWKHTYQDEHDQLKQVTKMHPVLQMYKDRVKEYFQHLEHLKMLEQNKILDQILDVTVTLDNMILFVRAFAHLYDIDVDYESNLSIKQAYLQIKYYLDNEIPYANDIRCIDYHEEPIFQNVKFLDNLDDTKPEVIGVGDENLLEDLVYKCKQSSFLVDQVLETML